MSAAPLPALPYQEHRAADPLRNNQILAVGAFSP